MRNTKSYLKTIKMYFTDRELLSEKREYGCRYLRYKHTYIVHILLLEQMK